MIKNLFLLPVLMVGSFISAQCNIIGKPILSMNETAQYSVDVEGQCADCYQWKSTGNNIVLMEEGKKKSINIKGSGNGNATLSVAVLTPNGMVECTKNLQITDKASPVTTEAPSIANNQANTTTNNVSNVDNATIKAYFSTPEATMNTDNVNPNCDIDILDIKEVKVSDNIVGFFPSVTPNHYKYTWEVEYFNGEKSTSTEKIPQFSYDKKEKSFKSVNLKVLSSRCLRELTKTYTEGFWNFFN